MDGWLPRRAPRHGRRMRWFAAGTATAILAGCSNPFLESYRGARCPEVSTAHVAVRAPVDATLIGTSDFISEVAVGNPQAVAAAEIVGADIVQWDRAFLRQDVSLAKDALAGDGLAPSEVADELPVAAEGSWYRIHARFWRSNSLGGLPPTPEPAQAPSAATPEPAPTPAAAPPTDSSPESAPQGVP